MMVQYLVGTWLLTSAEQLHAVYDVILDAGHQIRTVQSRGQDGCLEPPPTLGAIVTHHIVQQPENTTHTNVRSKTDEKIDCGYTQ